MSNQLDVLPTDLDVNNTLITYRVLVSRREAGIIIGKNGDNISKIRDETNIKAGVSKLAEGCVDRILTVNGIVEDIPSALVSFAKSITEANVQVVKTAAANDEEPLSISYNFFPLKYLCPHPSPSEPSYEKTLTIRLLIPHSQMGTLIGKQGIRIKAIQENFNVKMVASKDYLPNSTERVVEVQGEENDLKNALVMISKCLLHDYHDVTGTLYYSPVSRQSNRSRSNYRYNSNNHNNSNTNNNNNSNNSQNNNTIINGSNDTTQSNGTSNSANSSSASAEENSGPNSNQNGGDYGNGNGNGRRNTKDQVESVAFAGELVGALIGKRGSRIQEIRRSSGCTITIDSDDNETGQRFFHLSGNASNIERALSLLYSYLEKEKQRRASLKSSSSSGRYEN
ncbi:unnamed protein product [[Candida] boidinii]|uniref:Unnamed protein product n=1 Tax=Candida boidinii TaxID=5477 RepID=A0ACB5TLC1_CANBO|nr:unnamed protein product [[Candida] boidinii]